MSGNLMYALELFAFTVSVWAIVTGGLVTVAAAKGDYDTTKKTVLGYVVGTLMWIIGASIYLETFH